MKPFLPPLTLPEPALSIATHSNTPALAVGLTCRGIILTDLADMRTRSDPFSAEISHDLANACRALSFITSDSFIAGTTEGKLHIFDASRRSFKQTFTLPTDSEQGDGDCSATTFYAIDENTVLVGDDAGGIHMLDLRQRESPVASALEQGDYISQICPVEAFSTNAYLAASGDGTLCAYDMRFPPLGRVRLRYASDSFDDDLLSLAILPETSQAVAGTLSGALNLYNLRFLDKDGDAGCAAHVDRFYGHPECVNGVLAVGDGGVITASSDGIVRVVDIVRKSLVGVLEYDMATVADKKRKKADGWPVEAMLQIGGLDKPAFALMGHDENIRFCDGSALGEDDEEDDHALTANGEATVKTVEDTEVGETSKEDVPETEETPSRKKKRKKFVENKSKVPADFFDDL